MSGIKFCSAYELLAVQLLQMWKKNNKKHNDNQETCGIFKKKMGEKKNLQSMQQTKGQFGSLCLMWLVLKAEKKQNPCQLTL